MEQSSMQDILVGNSVASADSIGSFSSLDLDAILHQKLERALHRQLSENSSQELSQVVVSHSPIDLAYSTSHFPISLRPLIFSHLPDRDSQVQFILNADSATRLTVFRYMNDQELKQIMERMSTEEAVRISEDLSERRFKRLMELLDPSVSSAIRKQKQHSRHSAGRLMTPDFFAFPMSTTKEDVSTSIRNNPKIDFTLGIFVLNEKNEVVGSVSNRNLLICSPVTPLKEIMRPLLYKVRPETTREEVVEIVERYKIPSLAVVDEENRLVGVIAHEDMIEVMEDLADETLANIAGTPEEIFSSEPIVFRFLARSPWLMVTLLVGLLNVFVMSFFQKSEGTFFTFTLFFVPLITGMSGNIGIQCSTVLVRSMALGNFSLSSKRDAFVKELSLGLFSGAIFGFGCGIVVGLIDFLFPSIFGGISPFVLGGVVGIGLSGACCAGTLLGVSSPLFFSRLGIDPAIASGPIVAAFNDFLSMSIYFLISWGLGTIFLRSF